MKRYKINETKATRTSKYKIIGLGLCLVSILTFVSCKQVDKPVKEKKSETTYSNMASDKSLGEVEGLLATQLDRASVDSFIKLLREYNEVAGSTGLRGDFAKYSNPKYDIDKISSSWNKEKGDFIGTNCRINSYILLKGDIKLAHVKMDDRLLYLDNDAIEKGKLFDAKDAENFRILFSRVKTQATKDVKVHAANMEKYFKNISFSDRARMISVVLHDNVEGDYLFVGHVGVLVPDKKRYLFVEKLSFEEPYQALKFSTREDCYRYLKAKYGHYTGEGLAKPFIMDNGKWVDIG